MKQIVSVLVGLLTGLVGDWVLTLAPLAPFSNQLRHGALMRLIQVTYGKLLALALGRGKRH